MNDLKLLIKQTFWVYFFGYLAAPLGYIIRIIYAKQFSLKEFGLIYSIISLITLISVFNDFGFTETMNYYVTRFFEKKQYDKIKSSLIFSVIMQLSTAAILSIILFYVSPILSEKYFKTIIATSTLRWFLLYMIIYNVSMPLVQIFVATHNYFFQNLCEFIRLFFVMVLSSLIIFFPELKNTTYIAISWIGGGILLLLFLIPFLFLKFPKVMKSKTELKFSLYKKLFKYAFYVILGNGAVIILTKLDIVILTLFRQLDEVAYYSASLSLAMMILLLIGPMLYMIFPLTSKYNINKEKKKIEIIIKSTYIIGLFIVMPLLVIFITYPSEIITLFFGEQFLPGKVILQILAVALFINIFSTFNYNIMAGLGLAKKRMIIMYIVAILNIIGNFALVPFFGMLGAAISTLSSIILMLVLTQKQLIEKLRFKLDYNNIFKIIICNILLIFIITFLKDFLILNLFIEAFLIGIVSLIIYLLMGHILKIINYRHLILLFIKNIK